MKCSLCKQKVEVTFLEKVLGTYVKDATGKKYIICVHCQREHRNDKEEILAALKKKPRRKA